MSAGLHAFRVKRREILENWDTITVKDCDKFNLGVYAGFRCDVVEREFNPEPGELVTGVSKVVECEPWQYTVDMKDGVPFMVSLLQALYAEEESKYFARASFWILEAKKLP